MPLIEGERQMHAEDVFIWAIGIGVALGLATAVVTAVLMWRHGGNSIGEIAKYTTSAFLTPAFAPKAA